MQEAFYNHTAFHESYFEHPCNVATEQDVLYTDIRGHGWRAKAKRWFHSWFLLSYNDERCRIYYVSSHALRLERASHYRKYRGRIHPLSKFSKVWTVFFTIILILNRLLFNLNTAMFYGSQTSFNLVLGVVLEAMPFIDILINFKTGYADHVSRLVYLDATLGYTHYASTKLVFHAFAAMPLQSLMMLRYGLTHCLFCRATIFICTLKLLSFFSLLRLYDVTGFLDRQRSSFKKMHLFKCLRIVLLAFLTMLQVIDLIDTVNIMVMLNSHVIYKDSYLSMVMRAKVMLHDMPNFFLFCVEFSTLCKSVMLFGYGLYRHDYYLDKVFSLLCHVIGCIFFTWAAMECFAITNRNTYRNDSIYIRRERTKAWMRSSQLSDKIYNKVQKYYRSYLSYPRYIERYNYLYKFLPTALRREINVSAYYNSIRRIPYFAEWPVDVIEELVYLLKDYVFLKHDVVSHAFSQGEGLIIIYAGVLAVYNVGQKEMGHLIDGDYFGELSLVTDKEVRTSTVVAATVCQVLLLNKIVFRNLMRKYTKLFFELRTALLQKYDLTQNQDSFVNFAQLDT